MHIDFNIQRKNVTFIPSDELLENLENYRNEILSMREICGCITISDGASNCVIEDELRALIYNFCLLSLPQLIELRKTTYHFYEVYGEIQMEAADGAVHIHGDFIEEILVPENEFIISAFKCAQKYIQLLKTLDEEKLNGDLKLLQDAATETLQQLAAKYPELL